MLSQTPPPCPPLTFCPVTFLSETNQEALYGHYKGHKAKCPNMGQTTESWERDLRFTFEALTILTDTFIMTNKIIASCSAYTAVHARNPTQCKWKTHQISRCKARVLSLVLQNWLNRITAVTTEALRKWLLCSSVHANPGIQVHLMKDWSSINIPSIMF